MRIVRLKCVECGCNTELDPEGNPGACIFCGKEFQNIEFIDVNGFVYVLSNPAMPGLVKIGFTNKSVAERVSQLSMATAVPARFEVEAYFGSPDARELETKAHEYLARARVERSEFFSISPLEVVFVIMRLSSRNPVFVSEQLLKQMVADRE